MVSSTSSSWKWQAAYALRSLAGWTTIFTENHDQPRSISRYCSDKPEYRKQAGKMLALMQSTLTGTQFIYQGQEIGTTNCEFVFLCFQCASC